MAGDMWESVEGLEGTCDDHDEGDDDDDDGHAAVNEVSYSPGLSFFSCSCF